MKLSGRIHRVEGVGDVNAYALIDDDGITLIDTGFPGKADAVLSSIRDLGYSPRDVHTIVVTHGDGDHIGNAAALRSVTGARIAVGKRDAAALTGGPYERGKGIMRVFHALVRRMMNVETVVPDVLLRDGDTISGLRVHDVPGHTAGSIALSTADGAMFSGDALLCDERGNAKTPPAFAAYDGSRLRASAEAIQGMGYGWLFPGHGKAIRAKR